MGQSVLIGSPSFLAIASPCMFAAPAGASAIRLFNAVTISALSWAVGCNCLFEGGISFLSKADANIFNIDAFPASLPGSS